MSINYESEALDIDLESLPIPTGYKILIYVPEVKAITKGGIHIPDALAQREKTAAIVGLVLKKGPACYDPEKFPSGPYCQDGEWVMFHSYSGNRFRVGSKEYRLINDDTVEAVVKKPEMLERA